MMAWYVISDVDYGYAYVLGALLPMPMYLELCFHLQLPPCGLSVCLLACLSTWSFASTFNFHLVDYRYAYRHAYVLGALLPMPIYLELYFHLQLPACGVWVCLSACLSTWSFASTFNFHLPFRASTSGSRSWPPYTEGDDDP